MAPLVHMAPMVPMTPMVHMEGMTLWVAGLLGCSLVLTAHAWYKLTKPAE